MKTNKWMVAVMTVICTVVFTTVQPTYADSLERNTALSSTETNNNKTFQYGAHKGDGRFVLLGGASFPTSDDNADKYVKTGFGGGFQMLGFITNHFAFGIEMSSGYFSGKKLGNVYISGAGTLYNARVDAELYQLLSMARIYINPQNRIRFYTPVGVGGALQRTSTHGIFHGHAIKEHDNELSFTAYGGVGLEFDITKRVCIGAEGRFQYAKFDGELFNNLSALGHIDIKF